LIVYPREIGYPSAMAMNNKSGRIISTIKDQVYSVIKENILNEHFKPGQRLQELQIAKDLNVSRSPVRSAINELIGEGLLESIPNKSVMVRRLSEKDIVDAYEFRLVVEGFAVQRTIELMDDAIAARLRAFRDEFTSHDDYSAIQEYIKVDTAFHEFLVSTAGNSILIDSLDKVAMLINPFRVFSLSSQQRFLDSIEEHTGLIDSILDRDAARAGSICTLHLRLAKEEIIKHLRSAKA